MQIQKVFRAGNSSVVAIPSDYSKSLGIKVGQKVSVSLSTDQKSLIIGKAGANLNVSSVTPDFLNVLSGINKRYGEALSELAKK